VNQAILILERNGPAEGRPLVDSITASLIANMKELRPPSSGRSADAGLRDAGVIPVTVRILNQARAWFNGPWHLG